MKKFYFFTLVLFSFFTGHSQTYRMLNRNAEYYFLSTGTMDPYLISGLKCDSVSGNTTDTSYYPYRTIAAVLPADSACNMDPDYPIWAGKEIMIDVNGRHHWTTISGDSVIINSQTIIGDTQVIYNFANADKIVAIHLSNALQTFANITDSVKIYSLQALDPANMAIASWWNGKQIVISKNNGVVKMPTILNFPNDTSVFTRVAAKRLKYGDCYPWQPGDELHENSHSFQWMSFYYGNAYYNKYILSRTMINPDSVVFTIRRFVHLTGNAPPSNTIFTDTITFGVGRLSAYIETKMPQQTIDSLRTYDLHAYPSDCGKLRMGDHIIRETYINGPGCVQQNNFEPAFYDSIFVEGVAGYYFHDFPSAQNNVTEGTFDFTYYSIGSSACGIPQYIGMEELSAQQFHAWPNPANDVINFDLPAGFSGSVMLYDVSGKEIRITKLASEKTLDVRDLSNGFYTGRFISTEGNAAGYFRFVKY